MTAAMLVYGYNIGNMIGMPDSGGVSTAPLWMRNPDGTVADYARWEDRWFELNGIQAPAPDAWRDRQALLGQLGMQLTWYGDLNTAGTTPRLIAVAKQSVVIVDVGTEWVASIGLLLAGATPEVQASWDNMLYDFVARLELPVLAGPGWFLMERES